MKECISCNHERIREKLQNSNDYLEKVNLASNLFSLLGDPSRMKIVLALMEGELCVYHICEVTGAKQSATSQHLRKLKDANVVKARKESNQMLYSIADDHVTTILKTVIEHMKCK